MENIYPKSAVRAILSSVHSGGSSFSSDVEEWLELNNIK